MRYRGGRSPFGLKIGKLIFSEVLKSSYESPWRIGNKIDDCTLCGRCEMICPANAISVSVHNRTWTLNNGVCRQCLQCIVKCPQHCLNQVFL
ncbi:DUF362 domain-containing protein [Methanobrevibacter sp.]